MTSATVNKAASAHLFPLISLHSQRFERNVTSAGPQLQVREPRREGREPQLQASEAQLQASEAQL
jgi:hypothetical protein